MKLVLPILLAPALVAAQYDYGPTTTAGSSPATSAPPAAPSAPADTDGHMNINVAAGMKFVFTPSNIQAPVGTLVTFWFPHFGIAHSVTQGTFDAPCTYLAASGDSPAGFDSGLIEGSTFTINITSTDPIWYHCKQVSHCGMGMIGAINAPDNGTNSFDNYMSAAMSIGQSGEPTQTDGSFASGGVNAIATGPPVPDTSGTANSPDSPDSPGAGIKLGVSGGISALVLGLIGALI